MSTSHLTIEIAEPEVRFLSFQGGEAIADCSIHLDVSNYSTIKENLDKFIDQNSFISDDYDEVSLSIASKKSSLVPNTIFDESSANDIYKLCFGECESNKSINYNRIAELSIVNVFCHSDWIKRFFVMRFPRVIMQHEGSHSLRSILSSNSFYLKTTVILHADFFQLTIVKRKQLEFYSFFDYQNHEDVLYHLLFALQQKEFVNEEGSVEFIQAIGCSNQTIENIERDFAKIKDLNTLKLIKPSNFIANSQLLCV